MFLDVSSAHYLQLVQNTFSIDQHGLRERDIDVKTSKTSIPCYALQVVV